MRLLATVMITFTLSIATAGATDPKVNYFDNLQSGWNLYGTTETIPKSQNPAVLEQKIDEDLQILLNEKVFGNNKVVMLAKGKQIVARHYAANQKITPGGNSITKSIVSLLFGKAICAGKIQLNSRIDHYVDTLKGTSWGNSTVKQLLTMSSGAFPTLKFLAGHKNRDMADALTKSLRGQDSLPTVNILIKFDGKKFTPGSRFIYSNADTAALGLALSRATATPVYDLMKPLWNEIGASHDAFWLKNSHGEAHTYSGFAANPTDWVLLGHYVINNFTKDTCFAGYLKEATKKQIDNPAFGDNREYGYHIWTGCGVGTNAFCFVGAFGQLLLIEPKTNLVLYVHSVASKWGGINYWENYLFEAYKKYKT